MPLTLRPDTVATPLVFLMSQSLTSCKDLPTHSDLRAALVKATETMGVLPHSTVGEWPSTSFGKRVSSRFVPKLELTMPNSPCNILQSRVRHAVERTPATIPVRGVQLHGHAALQSAGRPQRWNTTSSSRGLGALARRAKRPRRRQA
jgi:hypothetical protein